MSIAKKIFLRNFFVTRIRLPNAFKCAILLFKERWEMNIKKLAEITGVSAGTVSKAFSGSKEISEITREKIFAAAKENGCFEQFDKKGTIKKVIAVICHEIESEYYARAVAATDKYLTENGAIMALSLTGFSHEKQAELVSYYSSRNKADGIIVFNSANALRFNPDVPIVEIGGSGKSEVDIVRADDSQAFNDAIVYLKQNGHTEIGFIGEQFTKSRQTQFVKLLKENGLTPRPEYIFTSSERFQTAGYNEMNKIYALKTRPTAIVAAYDQIALGAIRAIRDHGDGVPETFSIIGFNDIPIASYYNISLTTIRDNLTEVCRTAVDVILKKTENKYYNVRQRISLNSELVIRKTVKNVCPAEDKK